MSLPNDNRVQIPLWFDRNAIKSMGFDDSQITNGDLKYIAWRIAKDFFEQRLSSSLRETVEFYINSGKAQPESVKPLVLLGEETLEQD